MQCQCGWNSRRESRRLGCVAWRNCGNCMRQEGPKGRGFDARNGSDIVDLRRMQETN